MKPRADRQSLGKRKTDHGKSAFFSEGGAMKDGKKMMSKVATEKVKGHEKRMHGMKAGGKAYAKGGGVESKGKTQGKMVAMKGGGRCR